MDSDVQDASGCSAPDASLGGAPLAVALLEAGKRRGVEAYPGETLLLALKRAGLPLLAVCGGKGACGTCKVSFAPDWAMRLATPQKREKRLLDFLEAQEGERLSCQISLTAALDGLEVHACN